MAHTRQGLSRSSAVELGRAAAAGADDVLSAAPFVGDRLTARAVEEFVEAVADALRLISAQADYVVAAWPVAQADGARRSMAANSSAVPASVRVTGASHR